MYMFNFVYDLKFFLKYTLYIYTEKALEDIYHDIKSGYLWVMKLWLTVLGFFSKCFAVFSQ